MDYNSHTGVLYSLRRSSQHDSLEIEYTSVNIFWYIGRGGNCNWCHSGCDADKEDNGGFGFRAVFYVGGWVACRKSVSDSDGENAEPCDKHKGRRKYGLYLCSERQSGTKSGRRERFQGGNSYESGL